MTSTLADEADYLASIIFRMSTLQTNPVLLSLENESNFVANKKYNLPAIKSKNFNLRVFYHQHRFPDRSPDEHGHFHLFTRSKQQTDWQHLLAISMDRQGQPVQFSTVNQWVTDSDWVEQIEFEPLFQQLQQQDPESLLLSWFIAILCLFKDEVSELITKRDLQLSDIKETSAINDILNDRSVYTLSTLPLKLEQKLTQA